MNATVKRKGRSYTGHFLDGARGRRPRRHRRLRYAGPRRADPEAQQARRRHAGSLASKNQLNITVSVNVGETLVPVIGMKLDRIDSVAVGAVE
jgi:hypothetical protein